MSMPWQLANSKRRRSRHFEPRPTIELMPSININELRHVIPRYHGQVNEPNVDLKYPDLAYLRLSASCLEIMGRNGYTNAFASYGFLLTSADIVLYSSVAVAVAVLFDCSATTAITPAASATERSICHKSKRPPVASASLPQNSASNLAVGQTLANHCHRKPKGSTTSAIKSYAIKSKNSKHKPIEHVSVNRSTFAPSLITSGDHAPP
jgi:hypothetical protein